MRRFVPLCTNGVSSLALVDGFLLASQVLLDARKADACVGRERQFARGFLQPSCQPRPELHTLARRGLDRLAKLAKGIAPVPPSDVLAVRRANASREENFTIFVSRDDMGNLGHHMGDLLGVWHLVDHLQCARARMPTML